MATLYKRTCPQCGKEYETYGGQYMRKFCSKECAWASNRDRYAHIAELVRREREG